MDKLSEWMINKIDRWYVKSSLPKTLKEFIFLFVVLTATLIGDLHDAIHRRS